MYLGEGKKGGNEFNGEIDGEGGVMMNTAVFFISWFPAVQSMNWRVDGGGSVTGHVLKAMDSPAIVSNER